MSVDSSLDYQIPNPQIWKPLVVRELEFKTMRSRGPGGQHVNRTESAIQVIWPLERSEIFNPEQKAILRLRLNSMLNVSGELYLRIESERSLLMNKEEGIKKILNLIEKSFFKPKKRHKTKPSRSSVHKRIKTKTIRSEVKKMRKVSRNDF